MNLIKKLGLAALLALSPFNSLSEINSENISQRLALTANAIESQSNQSPKRYESDVNDCSYGPAQIRTDVAKVLEKRHSSLPRITDYPIFSSSVDPKTIEYYLQDLYDHRIYSQGKRVSVVIDGKPDVASKILLERVQKRHSLPKTIMFDSETKIAIQKDRFVQKRLYDKSINFSYSKALFQETIDYWGTNNIDLIFAEYNAGRSAVINAAHQGVMNRLYGTCLLEDGVIGDKTRKRIIDIQLKKGLLANGKIERDFILALKSDWCKKFCDENFPIGAVPKNSRTDDYVKRSINYLKAYHSN